MYEYFLALREERVGTLGVSYKFLGRIFFLPQQLSVNDEIVESKWTVYDFSTHADTSLRISRAIKSAKYFLINRPRRSGAGWAGKKGNAIYGDLWTVFPNAKDFPLSCTACEARRRCVWPIKNFAIKNKINWRRFIAYRTLNFNEQYRTGIDKIVEHEGRGLYMFRYSFADGQSHASARENTSRSRLNIYFHFGCGPCGQAIRDRCMNNWVKLRRNSRQFRWKICGEANAEISRINWNSERVSALV